MKNEPAVIVKNLYKSFRLPHEQHSGIKQLIVNFAKRKKGFETQHVLDDVSLEIKKGEFFGIVGRNGSGKSTLLKLLAGIYAPDKGLVKVNGTLTPFIELGVGFNPELTGRENVYMNGALLGFGRNEMDEMYDGIVEFAELERFMDQKLKNYSSGMQVRLAFSIAIKAKPDVLLLDEVLAVGDANFQRKCLNYFKKLKADKRTVIFISHDMNAVEEFCDRVMILNKGKVTFTGKASEAAARYNLLNFENKSNSTTSDVNKNTEGRTGSGEVVIKSLKLLSGNKEVSVLKPNQPFSINLNLEINSDVEDIIVGIQVLNMLGKPVFGTNNKSEKEHFRLLKSGTQLTFSASSRNILNNGSYTLAAAVKSHDRLNIYDQLIGEYEFNSVGWKDGVGDVFVNFNKEVVLQNDR